MFLSSFYRGTLIGNTFLPLLLLIAFSDPLSLDFGCNHHISGAGPHFSFRGALKEVAFICHLSGAFAFHGLLVAYHFVGDGIAFGLHVFDLTPLRAGG